MPMKPHWRQPRIRWAIQMMSLNGHPDDRRKWSEPLGVAWIDREMPRQWSESWPASFLTRREARAAANALRERTAQHSDWRFRPVKMAITVEMR